MSRCRLTALATLAAAVLLGTVPGAWGHGGHGGGHGGYGGYGGYHGYGGYGGYGYHGYGWGGYGYRGFGYGGYGYRGLGYGFGYPGFGYGYGYPGFGYGGLGYGGLGLGGLGFGRFGYGGLGYGGLGLGGLGYGGYGGLGYGGLGYGGLGYGGYGGLGYGYGGCGCYPGYGAYGYDGLGYGGYGGMYPLSTAPNAPGSGGALLVSTVGAGSRYVDYYTRTRPSLQPSLIALGNTDRRSRYVDYYAHNSRPAAPVQAEEEGQIRTVSLTPDNKAHIQIDLPTNARLWVNGQPLEAIGPQREYVSAKLVPDEVYTCRLRASWTENGRAFEERVEVKVEANKTTRITFGTPLP